MHVKAPKKAKDPLRFDEVQENMKKSDLTAQITANKDQWMTPDLLQKISQNPKLLEGFKDPETMQAIAIMQKDPKLAKKKYAKNPKITAFIVEFSKIMGSHFTEIGQKEQKKQEKKPVKKKPEIREVTKKTREQVELEKKLQDPLVKRLMAEPQVQNFIRFLQTSGQPLDFFQLARSNPELAHKIKILLEKGIFNASFQR